ncbi:MAG TPA: hypothetical protein VF533_10590 [Solirubrobacteraceae bacterium]|jgi:hypothetical protein
MKTTRLIVLAAAAAPLLLPGAADAAVLTAIKPCYVSVPGTAPDTETIDLAGSGFTPNARVDIDIDGQRTVTGAPVDAAGTLATAAKAPFVAERDRPFTITATEQGAPAPAAVAESRVTALNVGIFPAVSPPTKKVRFRGRGFTAGGKVYAHYRFRGKTRKTVVFRTKGPCGKFKARKRQIPVKRARTGEWIVQFDHHKRFTETPEGVVVRLRILVERKIRF